MYPEELRKLEILERQFEEIGERYYGSHAAKYSKNNVKVTPVGNQNSAELTKIDLNATAEALQRNYIGSKGNFSYDRENTLGA